MCTGTTPACGNTCARGAGTHGDVLNLHTEVFWTDTRERGEERKERGGGSPSVLLTKKSPRRVLTWPPQVHHKKPLDLTHSRFENRWRTTRSRVLQSFALPDEAVELHFYLEGNFGGESAHTTHNTHIRTNTCPSTHPGWNSGILMNSIQHTASLLALMKEKHSRNFSLMGVLGHCSPVEKRFSQKPARILLLREFHFLNTVHERRMPFTRSRASRVQTDFVKAAIEDSTERSRLTVAPAGK